MMLEQNETLKVYYLIWAKMFRYFRSMTLNKDIDIFYNCSKMSSYILPVHTTLCDILFILIYCRFYKAIDAKHYDVNIV